MEQESTTNERSLKDTVMNRIECGAVSPRSKLFYTTRECTVWALWLLSVLIGAFAVAVVTFVVTHHEYALYEATHENFATFMVEALPYLWLITFGVMAAVAVYNLKHTKHGYRYQLWQVFGSSLVLSLVGGSVLHLFGFGYTVDHVLGREMPMYMSEEERDTTVWNNPMEGRLLGSAVRPIEPPEVLMTFADASGNEWKLNVEELSPNERTLLGTRQKVRLIGVVSDNDNSIFYSCGVFPWILDKSPSRQEFMSTRKDFEDRIHAYEERFEKVAHLEDGDERGSAQYKESPCHEMAPLRRMKPRMMAE